MRNFLYDNETFKWESEGKKYCLHIRCDENAINPRQDYDHITTLASWSRDYAGDDIDGKTQEKFWRMLVSIYVPRPNIFEAAKNGEVKGLELKISEDVPLVNVIWDGELMYGGITRDQAIDYIVADLDIDECPLHTFDFSRELSGPFFVCPGKEIFAPSAMNICHEE